MLMVPVDSPYKTLAELTVAMKAKGSKAAKPAPKAAAKRKAGASEAE